MTKKKDPAELKIRDLSGGPLLCKGPCGRTLPPTDENFYFRLRKSNGKMYPSPYCKACEKEKASSSRKARYASGDKEKILTQNKEWRDRNPDVTEEHRLNMNSRYKNDPGFRENRKLQSKNWRIANPEKKAASNAASHQRLKPRNKRKFAIFAALFPDIRLRGVIRSAVCEALRLNGGSKNGRSILKHLPYTMVELRQHLESLWEPWMNWSNYGPYDKENRTWHIDHKTPQSSLPYADFSDENFLLCWALTNLRPLCSLENIKKGNRSL